MQKRETRIEIVVTPEESEAITKAAEAQGLKRAAFIRWAVLRATRQHNLNPDA